MPPYILTWQTYCPWWEDKPYWSSRSLVKVMDKNCFTGMLRFVLPLLVCLMLTFMFMPVSEVIFKPSRYSYKVQPMKELRERKNGSVTVHGSEVVQCSPMRFDTTTAVVTTSTTTIAPPEEGTVWTSLSKFIIFYFFTKEERHSVCPSQIMWKLMQLPSICHHIIFSMPALLCRRAIAIPPASASAPTYKMFGQMLKSWNFSLSLFFVAFKLCLSY